MRVLVAALSAVLSKGQETQYQTLWEQFKRDFSKTYDSNGDEEAERYQIFRANVDTIANHNAKKLSYTLGINEFADMTSDEFAAIYIGGYRPGKKRGNALYTFTGTTDSPPSEVDWVSKGGVTPVKNQGNCGSCWAFSTTGALEGAHFAETGKLVSLSEEEFVQCDHNGDLGCRGGLMDNAFEWAKTSGVCSEATYPYTSGSGLQGTCRKSKCKPAVVVKGHVDVTAGDEAALKAAVAQQPVSVAIEADKVVFHLYSKGVIDSPDCGTELDHGVLAVGYGTDGDVDYWKVKNSWSATWGEAGYVRIARGKNMCGIAQSASFPVGVADAQSETAVGDIVV